MRNLAYQCRPSSLWNSDDIKRSFPKLTKALTELSPTGLQEFVIVAGREEALDTSHKLLPQYLRELGYSTHLVGKVRKQIFQQYGLQHGNIFMTLFP